MLLFGLASSFLWLQHTIVCVRERELAGSVGHADKEACVPLVSSLSPRGPMPRHLEADPCHIEQEFQMNYFRGHNL